MKNKPHRHFKLPFNSGSNPFVPHILGWVRTSPLVKSGAPVQAVWPFLLSRSQITKTFYNLVPGLLCRVFCLTLYPRWLLSKHNMSHLHPFLRIPNLRNASPLLYIWSFLHLPNTIQFLPPSPCTLSPKRNGWEVDSAHVSGNSSPLVFRIVYKPP